MNNTDNGMTQDERYRLEARLIELDMLQGLEYNEDRQEEMDELKAILNN